ncbi:MAG: hypothetical protein V8T30_07720 [Ruminococcus sp.]
MNVLILAIIHCRLTENSEDELSLLDNQIYRTTVKFREQAENSRKDKENLQKSIVRYITSAQNSAHINNCNGG